MLSPEAQAYFESLTPDDPSADEASVDMEVVRRETRALYAAASERAIVRFELDREEIELDGVACERIISKLAPPEHGTLFYMFGGGFMVGDPFSDLPIIGALAAGCGVEVVAVKYRLAPEHPAPAASDDCFAVYRALVAEGRAPVLAAGESAGGNLALLTVQRARDGGLPLPKALGLLSPAVDLRTDRDLFAPVVDADPTLHYGRILEVEAAYVAGQYPTDPSISPAFGTMHDLPPTIITTGTRDLLMPMCLRLARSMRRAEVEVDCRVWDGLWHVFEYYDDYPESAESLAEIAEFLRRRL